ncbi:MAG: hypothetical protein CSA76_03890 [Spirochaetales bacterium]|nr:MAG: hypothetical protein CSA76_03890 [Spirochaetales bacterium]
MQNGVHFYVTLKTDFLERCGKYEGNYLFKDMENPWLEARERLTPGRLYPVLGVEGQGRSITILDDSGRSWNASLGLFMFAEDASSVDNEKHNEAAG